MRPFPQRFPMFRWICPQTSCVVAPMFAGPSANSPPPPPISVSQPPISFRNSALTGETGMESIKLKNIAKGGSWFYSVGPSIDWDLFDAGRVRADIDVQNSLQRQALETYQAAVLQALSDVDSALVTYEQEQDRRVALSQDVQSNQRAVNLSIQLYTRGLLDFLSVLDAERSLFAAQSSLVQSDQNISSDLVSLYKALVGGWQTGI